MTTALAWTPLVGAEYRSTSKDAKIVRRVTAIIDNKIHFEYGYYFDGKWSSCGFGDHSLEYFTETVCLPEPSGPMVDLLRDLVRLSKDKYVVDCKQFQELADRAANILEAK